MSVHAWCSDPARDESVRAAEDNRQGPLPTLEEAIWAARAMMPKSVSATSAPEPENKGNGMRTERVTLEIRHVCAYPAAEWLLEIAQDTCRDPGESVRVVEEVAIDAAWAERITAERDAAIRERDEFRKALNVENDHALRIAAERDALKARVAELESAPVAESATTPPPARGWLTEEERRDLWEIASLLEDSGWQKCADALLAILARSTPPEVVLPPMPDCSPMADYGAVWRDCLVAVREALRRAGVKVQQPLPPEVEANG